MNDPRKPIADWLDRTSSEVIFPHDVLERQIVVRMLMGWLATWTNHALCKFARSRRNTLRIDSVQEIYEADVFLTKDVPSANHCLPDFNTRRFEVIVRMISLSSSYRTTLPPRLDCFERSSNPLSAFAASTWSCRWMIHNSVSVCSNPISYA